MTPYEQGWEAAASGVPFKGNPWPSGTGDWLAWRNGWRHFAELYFNQQ